VVEYQRRHTHARWWCELAAFTWLWRNQRVAGIVALGSVTECEFTDAFSRWPTTLRLIDASAVREEVYRTLHPSKIAILPNARRYQTISFTVGPRRSKCAAVKPRIEALLTCELHAMPCLF
jgi:hypothetical protein